MCYQAPHYPEKPSDSFYDLHRGKTIKKRANFEEGVEPFTPTFSPKSPQDWNQDADFQRYGGNMEEYLRCYSAMVSQIDHNVGRIIDYLKTNGLWDNTAVFFTADHGDMQGSHGLKNKCYPWEESAGIPMIARIPGGLSGVRRDDFVTGIDTYPTFLEIAGIENQADIRGTSFARLLSDTAPQDRIAVSEGMNMDWTMICHGDYKLVLDRQSATPDMLYNLQTDPFELTNLVDQPEQKERIAAMRSRLLEVLPA